jgi:hypothetical protein
LTAKLRCEFSADILCTPQSLSSCPVSSTKKKIFTTQGAVSLRLATRKFTGDLTTVVLGRSALQTYYPDTLLALADENSSEADQ